MVRTAAAEEELKQRSFSESPEIARGTDSSHLNHTPETVQKMPSIREEDFQSDATEEVLIIEESEEEIS